MLRSHLEYAICILQFAICKHPHSQPMIQKLRVPLGFFIAALVIYLAKPTGTTILLGLPFALAGAMLRGLAAGTIRKDSQLATDGPYAWTRNPLYLGSFLLQLGFGVMSGSWIAAGVTILPSFVIYPNVIRNEEGHLLRLFPEEFRKYCDAVPRFFPRFRPSGQRFSLKQYLANREYNTALGFATVLAVFVVKWRLI
jgi:protein-S-isoprenylcysteine O-methyltransferase Ste14